MCWSQKLFPVLHLAPHKGAPCSSHKQMWFDSTAAFWHSHQDGITETLPPGLSCRFGDQRVPTYLANLTCDREARWVGHFLGNAPGKFGVTAWRVQALHGPYRGSVSPSALGAGAKSSSQCCTSLLTREHPVALTSNPVRLRTALPCDRDVV